MDAVGETGKRNFTQAVYDELKFLDYAPVLFASAKNGEGLRRIISTVRRVYEAASKRVTTGESNRFVETLKFESDIKIYYLTQASIRPPLLSYLLTKRTRCTFPSRDF